MTLLDFTLSYVQPPSDSEKTPLTAMHSSLLKYCRDNVLPVPAFKPLRAEADKLIQNTSASVISKFANGFPIML